MAYIQPINYSAAMPQIDLGANLLRGLQAGAAIREANEKARAEEEARALREQYSRDLNATLQNPTAGNFAALIAKYPGQREALSKSHDMLNTEQQDAEFGAGVQAWHAINTGNPQVALDLLDQRIVASENAGKDASKLKQLRDGIQRDPKTAGSYLGLVLSSVNPEKWSKIAAEQRATERAPAELTEAQAKAHSAAVAAKFAESNAALDVQKKGWDITKLQEDIKIAKQNAQIAAANVAIAREGNALKRQEMQIKLQDMQQKRDDAVREKVSAAETARATMDNMLNTIDRILNNKALNDVVGPVEGADLYPTTAAAMSPIGLAFGSSAEDRADAIALIDTLKSQVFLSQIPTMKGTGSLTEKEGEKLESGLQSLNRKQSEAQFRANLKEIQRLGMQGRSALAKKYGIPDTVPNTPAAAASTSPTDIDALIRKYAP